MEWIVRIGIVSTRLAGLDGVTFEVAKWQAALERMGHEVRLCAGELDALRPNSRLIPPMHFSHPDAMAISQAAFDPAQDARPVRREIQRQAGLLAPALADWVENDRLDRLIVQNAWAIPMQLPLAVALRRVVERSGIPTVSHNHDYWWERERFAQCIVPEILVSAFPPDLPNVRHVSINSIAADQLRLRRGIASVVVPNVFDFDQPRPKRSRLARQRLFGRLGLGGDSLLVVQPTRVVPRKGIELAIELVGRLAYPDATLLITGPAGDEGHDYLGDLETRARRAGVRLLCRPEQFVPQQAGLPAGPADTLHETYLAADLVTYPSLHEGWGNALVEALFHGAPLVINRYSVYEADIRPLGLRLIEIDGQITDETVAQVRALLGDPRRRLADARHNFEVGRRHLSFTILETQLRALIGSGVSRRSARAA